MALSRGARIGRYRIVGAVGAGGMGEVYRARDESLERDVAIKVLPDEVAGDETRLGLFESEARAVARLSHPNILAIHDFGSEGGVRYAVMEILEGTTLRARLGKPVPWRKVVETAAAIADGLAAAHGRGVIHRDVKPENLFVTNDGLVKILDFGLARVAPDREYESGSATPTRPATGSGPALGTVGYMAPEQVRGERADARSDIFSLGCVLYEMVTGRPPFARETAVETLAATLREEPPDPALSGAALPEDLSRILVHCLEKNPDARFQSARDLAFALRAVASGASSPSASRPEGHRRAALLWGSLAVILCAAVAAASWWWLRGRAVAPPAPALDPNRVVVAVFENLTGDPKLDSLGRVAADWITQGLSQITTIEVSPSGTTLDAARPPGEEGRTTDPVLALAGEAGAGTVVSGTYYLRGENLQFQARVTDARAGRLVQALDPVPGPRADPMLAIEVLRRRVMGAVASRDLLSAESPVNLTPPLFEAYQEYVAATDLFMTDDDEALRRFEAAARLDPSFSTPRLWLVFMYGQRGDLDRAREFLAGLAGERDRLTPFARSWLDALKANLDGRYLEALQSLREAQRLAPRNALVLLWVGLLATAANRPGEAAEVLSGVEPEDWYRSRHPLGASYLRELTGALHLLGEHDRELVIARRARGLYPNRAATNAVEARALAALGRVEEVERLLDECRSIPDSSGDMAEVVRIAGGELRAHGRRDASIEIANRDVERYRGQETGFAGGEAQIQGLAWALYRAERWAESRALFEKLAERDPGDVDDLGTLGVLAARLGDGREARRIDNELQRREGPRLYGASTYGRARIAAQLGEGKRALELLRRSFAEGYAFSTSIHRDMDLEPLRNDPGFQELLRPKG